MKNNSKKGIIIAAIIAALVIIIGLVIFAANFLAFDPASSDQTDEMQTEQVDSGDGDGNSADDQQKSDGQDSQSSKDDVSKEDAKYMVNMLGQKLGAIQGYQSGYFDSMEYDNYCDAGPSLSCMKAYENAKDDEDEYAVVYFAVDGYEADVNSECVIINACGQSSQITKELTNDMTLAEIKEKAGSVGAVKYDDYEGYYVTFQKDGYEFEYYWYFDFAGLDYSDSNENTAVDYKSYARDPNSLKSYGVYVKKI